MWKIILEAHNICFQQEINARWITWTCESRTYMVLQTKQRDETHQIKVSKAETRLHREVQQSRMQVSNHGEITRVSGQPKSVLPGVYSVEGQMFWHRNWHHRCLSDKFSVADAWCRHETWDARSKQSKACCLQIQKHNCRGRLMDRNERKMSRVKRRQNH